MKVQSLSTLGRHLYPSVQTRVVNAMPSISAVRSSPLQMRTNQQLFQPRNQTQYIAAPSFYYSQQSTTPPSLTAPLNLSLPSQPQELNFYYDEVIQSIFDPSLQELLIVNRALEISNQGWGYGMARRLAMASIQGEYNRISHQNVIHYFQHYMARQQLTPLTDSFDANKRQIQALRTLPADQIALQQEQQMRRTAITEPQAPAVKTTASTIANQAQKIIEKQAKPVSQTANLISAQNTNRSSDTETELSFMQKQDGLETTKTDQPKTKLSLLEKKYAPSLAQIQRMQPFAMASNFLYSNAQKDIPAGWVRVSTSELLYLTQGLKGLRVDKNQNITTKKGLVASLFRMPSGRFCLAFGGTTAGEESGGFMQRLKGNSAITAKQWLANAKNALIGKTPKMYKQAAELTEAIARVNSKIVLTGHSLGGGLAQHSAISVGNLERPIRCYAFCSAELGDSMQIEITQKCQNDEEKIKRLLSKIKNLNIEGDLVPNMNKIFSVTNLGKSYTIPHLGKRAAWTPSSLDYHIHFLNHINAFIDEKSQHD